MFNILRIIVIAFLLSTSWCYSSIEENDNIGIWIVLVKETKDEKFLVRFPKDPAISYAMEGKKMNFTEKEGNVFYAFSKEPYFSNLSKDELFSSVLKTLSSKDCKILSSTLKEEKNRLRLDFEYEEEGRLVKESQFVTASNRYILRTVFSSSDEEKHNYFTESFKIF